MRDMNPEGEKVMILGGDGFCGWPVALDQSIRGRRVTIVDDLSRRRIDSELGSSSLTPICSPADRLSGWESATGRTIDFIEMDVSSDPESLADLFRSLQPDIVIHFAEQRSAPYSMLSAQHRSYTLHNNVSATHSVLEALRALTYAPHLVHLGSVGVYGYSSRDWTMPEGYLTVTVPGSTNPSDPLEILHPFEPVSVYHLSKCLDSQMFEFYARHDGLRITDLHQGIVWGTQTALTMLDDSLINRFDYDSTFGTVVNRFMMQAAVGHPLTVYGTGGQTRAFINLSDAVKCVNIAIENPPHAGERVRIRNQVTECLSVRDVAELVSTATGAEIANVRNPRTEMEKNSLKVSWDSFHDLGVRPVRLRDRIGQECVEIVDRHRDRIDARLILPSKPSKPSKPAPGRS